MKPTTSSHEEEGEGEGEGEGEEEEEGEEGARGYSLHHSKWEGATKMHMKCLPLHHCSPASAREGPEQLLRQPVREGEGEGEREGQGQGQGRRR